MHTGDAQVKIIHWTVSDRIANCNPSLSRSTQAAFMSCWNFKMWLSTANRWHAAWLSFDAGLFWSETLIKRFTHRREVKVYFAETTPGLTFRCSAFEHPADVRFFCEPFVLEHFLGILTDPFRVTKWYKRVWIWRPGSHGQSLTRFATVNWVRQRRHATRSVMLASVLFTAMRDHFDSFLFTLHLVLSGVFWKI